MGAADAAMYRARDHATAQRDDSCPTHPFSRPQRAASVVLWVMDHVRWMAQPTLQRPTVIAAFTGWNDAGDAASNSVRHLIEAWNAQPLAEIDPEEFTDFATVRPHVRLSGGMTRSIVWPTVGLWSASTPGGDVILLLGPEPALRWRLFSEQVVAVATKFGSSMCSRSEPWLADVPTRDPFIDGYGHRPNHHRRFDLQRSRYEGPQVSRRAARRVREPPIVVASLWAAVPAYASQVPSPSCTRPVERACEMLGCPASTQRLVTAPASTTPEFPPRRRRRRPYRYVSRLESWRQWAARRRRPR